MARTADPHARGALLEAGRAEFAKVGLARARIEDIAKAAGLAKGSFYLHFEDKEALFQVLVDGLLERLIALIRERETVVLAFCEAHPLTARDVHERSRRHLELVRLEARYDRATLELMWAERDVFRVLLRGASGTRFDGLAWTFAEAEVHRIEEAYSRFQGLGVCRADVPPEVFGSLVVGTYLLLMEKLTRLESPPDFDQWVEAIQRLIREGSAPPMAAARSAAPRKVTRPRRAKVRDVRGERR